MFDALFGDPEHDPRAVVRLRWLRPDEGGRAAPPPGPRYVAAARFEPPGLTAGEVGVVLELSPDSQLATLRLLAPEDESAMATLIRPGARLVLLEARRVVAQAEVQYVAGLGGSADS